MTTKVLFAINNLAVGGAERMVLHQARFLGSERFEAWMICLLPDPEENFSQDAEFLGDRLVRFRMRNFIDVFTWWKVFSFLRREKFDAVVTSLFFTNGIVRLCAIILRVPVIISQEQNMYVEKRWWQIAVDKLLSFGTTKIIAVSKDVLEFTALQEHIPREKFIVNYNTTPFGAFESLPQNKAELKKKLGIPDDAIVVVAAGRLAEQKGHLFLIRAAGELRALHPEAKFRVIIFGEGRFKSVLEAEISKLGLGDIVRMPGIWPALDVMAITDIFVLASLWEGLPVVLVEAMAASKPIITTRVSGASELIEDKKSGFVVEPKDVSGMREKLFLFMCDADLRRKFGEAAKERSKEFSIEKHIAILESLLLLRAKG